MSLRLLPLLLCFGLILSTRALAEDPAGADVQQEEAETSALGELDSFVSEAIAGGLLIPSGDAPVQRQAPRVDGSYGGGGNVTLKNLRMVCPRENPYDFSDVEHLRNYTDHYPYKSRDESAGEALNVGLVKAYIALGLNSEAMTLVANRSDPQSVAYAHLIKLLDERLVASVPYFQAMTRCHSDTDIWVGAAMLKAKQASGVDLFEDNLSAARKLPFHMRETLAAIAVPELERRREVTLAQRVLADFSSDDLTNSPRLKFLVSLVNPTSGAQSVDLAVEALLSQSQFQDDALSLVLRNGESLDAARREVLLDEVIRQFDHAPLGADQSSPLQFALRELSAQGRYDDILRLFQVRSLQTRDAHTQIEYHLVGLLRQDLNSEDSQRKLIGLKALLTQQHLLERRSDLQAIYLDAAHAALALGLKSLAVDLSKRAGEDETLALARARIALEKDDFAFVYAYAEAYPDNLDMSLLGALSALEAGDGARVNQLERRVQSDETAVMKLLHEDALSERWLVSDELYAIAAAFPDPGVRAQVESLQVLRRRARGETPEQVELTIADFDTRLTQIGATLGSLSTEVH